MLPIALPHLHLMCPDQQAWGVQLPYYGHPVSERAESCKPALVKSKQRRSAALCSGALDRSWELLCSLGNLPRSEM